MKITKEEVREHVIRFLGEKWNNSIPYILTEVFLRFADEFSVVSRYALIDSQDSIMRTYTATVDELIFSLVVYKDFAFINILKPKVDDPLDPRTISVAKVMLTRSTLQVEALLKEEGICDFDLSVVQLIGKITKEIVQIRKQASL